MSKGISLAIETIIVLALGLTVFVVMVQFLNINANEAENEVVLITKQNQLCSAYVQEDRTCSNPNRAGAESIGFELADICVKLYNLNGRYAECARQGSGSIGPECLRDCCSLFCPLSPE